MGETDTAPSEKGTEGRYLQKPVKHPTGSSGETCKICQDTAGKRETLTNCRSARHVDVFKNLGRLPHSSESL